MTIQKLAESTIDSLQDNRQSLAEFLTALLAEANSQSERAAKESDDYTTEELEYWQRVREEAQPRFAVDPGAAKIRDAAVNLLWAVDKGYYFTTAEEITSSAFIAALRKAVA